jgi:hypothetical protein
MAFLYQGHGFDGPMLLERRSITNFLLLPPDWAPDRNEVDSFF